MTSCYPPPKQTEPLRLLSTPMMEGEHVATHTSQLAWISTTGCSPSQSRSCVMVGPLQDRFCTARTRQFRDDCRHPNANEKTFNNHEWMMLAYLCHSMSVSRWSLDGEVNKLVINIIEP